MRTLNRTLLTLTLASLATVAFAADQPKKESSFGTGKATGAYLTKEQLRACLAQQDKVKDQNAAMVKEQAALATVKEEIAHHGDELKQQMETVDRSNAEAVAAYNEAVQARDKQIDDYQSRADAFNKRVEAAQAQRDSFGQGCNNRRYFEEDEIAIRKGK